jgi:hybrid cluster-associated redox disulfide protein
VAASEEIGLGTTVDEVLARSSSAASVFLARRMHCVGCDLARFETIGDAARIYGLPADELVAALRRATSEQPEEQHDGP